MLHKTRESREMEIEMHRILSCDYVIFELPSLLTIAQYYLLIERRPSIRILFDRGIVQFVLSKKKS